MKERIEIIPGKKGIINKERKDRKKKNKEGIKKKDEKERNHEKKKWKEIRKIEREKERKKGCMKNKDKKM